MANRIVIVLIAFTVAMQAAILYRQHGEVQGPTKQTIRNAADGTVMDLAGLPSKGSSIAKVALVEFSDYECPYCGRHANGTAQELERAFVTTGKLMQVFANNPLAMHANAKFLATVAICAGQQKNYWEMHDRLFKVQPKSKEDVEKIVAQLPLDAERLQRCVDHDSDAKEQIARDSEVASKFQLTGTPGFALGRLDGHGRLVVDKFITGAQPFAVFEKAINEELKKVS
jgi:protein-disulfide isomerase